MVAYALAITVNATFGFTFTFSSDINSNDLYSVTLEGKGEATIQQEVSSEVASVTSQDNQGRSVNIFTSWLLGKELKPRERDYAFWRNNSGNKLSI